MANASYFQRGETIEYTAPSDGADIKLGQIIVFGSHVGVSADDIPKGWTGELHTTGIYDMPKSSTNAIGMGTDVYFDGTGITEDEGDSNVKVGYAVKAAKAGDTTIMVALNN